MTRVLIVEDERRLAGWIEAQYGDSSPPAFYAACKTEDGIVIVDGWQPTPLTRGSLIGWVLI